jgi:hypothetical protein
MKGRGNQWVLSTPTLTLPHGRERGNIGGKFKYLCLGFIVYYLEFEQPRIQGTTSQEVSNGGSIHTSCPVDCYF